jgi:hypothetical protein
VSVVCDQEKPEWLRKTSAVRKSPKKKSAYNYVSEDEFQQLVTQDIYIKIIVGK